MVDRKCTPAQKPVVSSGSSEAAQSVARILKGRMTSQTNWDLEDIKTEIVNDNPWYSSTNIHTILIAIHKSRTNPSMYISGWAEGTSNLRLSSSLPSFNKNPIFDAVFSRIGLVKHLVNF